MTILRRGTACHLAPFLPFLPCLGSPRAFCHACSTASHVLCRTRFPSHRGLYSLTQIISLTLSSFPALSRSLFTGHRKWREKGEIPARDWVQGREWRRLQQSREQAKWRDRAETDERSGKEERAARERSTSERKKNKKEEEERSGGVRKGIEHPNTILSNYRLGHKSGNRLALGISLCPQSLASFRLPEAPI